MSKILSTFLAAISTLLLPLILSGCDIGQLIEGDFPYVLRIENKISTPIGYCVNVRLPTCPHMVKSGEVGYEFYRGYVGGTDELEKFGAFDRETITICGKNVDMNHIRAISPIVKREDENYVIVINQSVADRYCDTTQ